jgi:hypothetical protein
MIFKKKKKNKIVNNCDYWAKNDNKRKEDLHSFVKSANIMRNLGIIININWLLNCCMKALEIFISMIPENNGDCQGTRTGFYYILWFLWTIKLFFGSKTHVYTSLEYVF